jgi:hypothetical protein
MSVLIIRLALYVLRRVIAARRHTQIGTSFAKVRQPYLPQACNMPFSPNASVVFLLLTILSAPLRAAAEDEATSNSQTEVNEVADNNTDTSGNGEQRNESQEAGTETATVIERSSPQPHINRHASLIAHLGLYQRQREVVQLVAADTPFNGLFLQETAGKPQGGILILHDNQQHGHWPAVTGPLREYLPDYGWATLAIELPSQPSALLPPRPSYDAQIVGDSELPALASEATEETQASNNSEEAAQVAEESDSTGIAASGKTEPLEQQTLTDNEPALPRLTGLPEIVDNPPQTTAEVQPTQQTPQQRYQQQMRSRLTAGMNYLNSRGQFNLVLIANGNSASWAIDFLNNKQQQRLAADQDTRGLALILVDPVQNTDNQLYLEQQLQQLEIPILDLVTEFNNLNPADNKRRAGMMRHRQRDSYRQIYIDGPDLSSRQHQTLKRRIRGWLKVNAAGIELPAS